MQNITPRDIRSEIISYLRGISFRDRKLFALGEFCASFTKSYGSFGSFSAILFRKRLKLNNENREWKKTCNSDDKLTKFKLRNACFIYYDCFTAI